MAANTISARFIAVILPAGLCLELRAWQLWKQWASGSTGWKAETGKGSAGVRTRFLHMDSAAAEVTNLNQDLTVISHQ